MDSEPLDQKFERFNQGYRQLATQMNLAQKVQGEFKKNQVEILWKLQEKLIDAVEQSNTQEIHLLSASMAHCLEVLQNSHNIFSDSI